MSIIVLDVGGTEIKYACMSEEGTLMQKGRTATPRENQEAFLAVLDHIIQPMSKACNGIAMSLPGTIDPITGDILQGGALTYNSNTNLKNILKDCWHMEVEIENDAKCAALAELTTGNLQGITCGMVLTFGTGIGGCVIIDGVIHHGAHHIAGEVSMNITKDLKTYGANAVWGSEAQGSIPGLVKRICKAKHVAPVDGVTVFEWIKQHDPIAIEVFDAYCEAVITQLFNIQLLIDPQRICIGGGVSQNPLFVSSLSKHLIAFYDRLPIPVPRMELMACRYHNDANLIGAFHRYQKQRKRR